MIRKSALIFLSVLLFFPAVTACADETEDSFAKANQYAQKHDYEKAAKEYQKVLAANPNDQKANLLLGLTYANTGELDEAVRYTLAALQLEKSYTGFHNLGLIYANKREYMKAVDAYKQALDLNPTSYRAWYQLGLVYASDLKFPEAVEAYEKVLELNPRFTDAFLGLGSAHYWAGDKGAAAEQVKKLREMGEKDKAQALENWIENKETKKADAKKSADSQNTPLPKKTALGT